MGRGYRPIVDVLCHIEEDCYVGIRLLVGPGWQKCLGCVVDWSWGWLRQRQSSVKVQRKFGIRLRRSRSAPSRSARSRRSAASASGPATVPARVPASQDRPSPWSVQTSESARRLEAATSASWGLVSEMFVETISGRHVTLDCHFCFVTTSLLLSLNHVLYCDIRHV